MSLVRSVCLIAVAAVLFPLNALGDVVSARIVALNRKSGDVTVVQSNGVRRPAETGTFLRDGDQLLITGNAYACIEAYDDDESGCHNAGTVTITAKVRDKRNPGIGDILNAWFEGPGRAISSMARTRGNADAVSGVSAHPVLPAEPGIVQMLPPNTQSIVPVWIGGQANVKLSAPSGEITKLAWPGESVRLTAPVENGTVLTVQTPVDGRPLEWRIGMSADVPSPPGFDESLGELSVVDRVDRAVWLLTRSGEPGWRLYALGELDAAALSGSYEAKAILAGILSDLCTSPDVTVENCPFAAK